MLRLSGRPGNIRRYIFGVPGLAPTSEPGDCGGSEAAVRLLLHSLPASLKMASPSSRTRSVATAMELLPFSQRATELCATPQAVARSSWDRPACWRCVLRANPRASSGVSGMRIVIMAATYLRGMNCATCIFQLLRIGPAGLDR